MTIAFHRIRFSWGPKTHIDLEWTKGRGEPLSDFQFSPAVVYAEKELEPDETAIRGIPALCWRDELPVLFEQFQLRENTEYFIDITLPLKKVDAQDRAFEQKGWPFAERLATLFKIDPPRRWKENDDGSVTISGQLKFGDHAGIVDLNTDYGSKLRAEVVCRKIDYFEEFKTLLNDIAEEMAELLLHYDSPVSASFNLIDVTSENEAALMFQLRYIMSDQNLPVAVDDLMSQFHSLLVERHSLRNIALIEEPDVESFLEDINLSLLTEGGPLSEIFFGYTPLDFPNTTTIEITDTSENRYVKYFLEEVFLLAQRLSQRLNDCGKLASARETHSWVQQLDEILSRGVWHDVGPFRQFPSNSQVLQKRCGYRDILNFDLALRMSLELPWKRGKELADGLIGDIRPVNELYEYWCFFHLKRTLAEICEAELPKEGSLIEISETGLQIRLLKGKRSRVGFLYRQTNERIVKVNLFYNRRFVRPNRSLSSWVGSYTSQFKPDYSIEVIVETRNITRRHWLHFDAKYRIEVQSLNELFACFPNENLRNEGEDRSSYETEIARFHKQDDLFKMHTYRDGILSSRGAYLLFPGHGREVRLSGKRQNLFIRHPSAFIDNPDYLFPSVGAFDLCPGRENLQRPVLRDFLEKVLHALLTDKPYKEEEGLFDAIQQIL